MLPFKALRLRGPLQGSITLPFSLPLTNGDWELGNASWWGAWPSGAGASVNVITGGANTQFVHSGSWGARAGSGSALANFNSTGAIPVAAYAQVDAGLCEYAVTAWLSGLTSDGDVGDYHVEFLDGSGARLGCVAMTTAPDLNTADWHQYSLACWVPPLTRTCSFVWRSERVSGVNLDSYLDDASHQLTAKPAGYKHVNLLNENASSVTGWTNLTGTLTRYAAGSMFGIDGLGFGATPTGEAYKEASVPAGAFTSVDAGTANVQLNTLCCVVAAAHSGRWYLEFYDVANALIGSRAYTDAANFSCGISGIGRQFEMAVPAGTRKVRCGFVGQRSGASGNLRFDTNILNLMLEYVP